MSEDPNWPGVALQTECGTWVLPCGHEVLDRHQVHYCSYIAQMTLRGRMAGQQSIEQMLGRPLHHPDELLFINVHAAVEILFHQIIFELRRVITLIPKEDGEAIKSLLERIRALGRLANETTQMLFKHFPKASFMEFRDQVVPASGAESVQYRLIEVLLGYREDTIYVDERGKTYRYRDFLDRALGDGASDPKTRWWVSQVESVMQEPSVRAELDALLKKHGATIDEVADSREHPLRLIVLSLYRLAKVLLTFRRGHRETAEHHIGKKPGTGHTSGIPYLQSVIDHPLFPEFARRAGDFDTVSTGEDWLKTGWS